MAGACLSCATTLAAVLLTASAAQGQSDQLDAIASWVAVDVATGYELRGTPALAEALPGWTSDRWGNLVTRVGSGSPRRVVACGLDRPSLVASQITDDGYLRVHRIGRGSSHPLWDQAFEAQQVRILTSDGPVAGVVARANGHFAAQHRREVEIVTADDLWIDVGASSAEEVTGLGIGLLDPVARHLPPWVMDGAVAGPDAGQRAGCAVVVALAEAARSAGAADGEIHFVLSAQQWMGWIGLSSYIAQAGAFDGVTLLSPGGPSESVDTAAPSSFGRMGPVLERAGVSAVDRIVPAVQGAGSHMEVISGDEASWAFAAAAEAVGITSSGESAWISAPNPVSLRPDHHDPSLARAADLLKRLVELHGAPGHEWAVRRFVLESLPAWARERAVVDDIGNVVVEAGPDRDTTVFMAHMDEVGYEVAAIAPDGVVTLARLGGAVSSAWEGQTALLHLDPAGAPSTKTGSGEDLDPRWKEQSLGASAPAPIRGVFLSRENPTERHPETLRAWFGMDANELAAQGAGVGAAVTSHKEGLRLGRHRFVARALDDRAGTTALLMAVQDLDPDALEGKVIFAWSVHEEGGLRGAAAMARRYGTATRRHYSVDTFVSSDTPLESPHFAYAPLGQGPVLRAVENSGVSPDHERARVFAAAERADIPIQMGLTQGSTDGTEFTFWGATNQGLSWPGRYSHSPGEVLDLRDLTHLARLVVAMATTGAAF
jgi:putative aminopeptidase FrvX